MQHLLGKTNLNRRTTAQTEGMDGNRRSTRGFTIVELLIVIVVIGILAAITIVAYNGIQTRAENAKTTQAVSQYVRGFFSYSSLNGTYPIQPNYPCLGSNNPQTICGNVGGGTACLVGWTVSSATFDNEMRTIFNGNMPQPSAQTMKCGNTLDSGAYYYPSTGKTAIINYVLRGNQACDGVGGIQSVTRQQQDDATLCQINLPTLP